MLRTTANTLAAGLLFLGLLHSLEVIAPGRAIDGKQRRFHDLKKIFCKRLEGKKQHETTS